jgi:endonuclease-3
MTKKERYEFVIDYFQRNLPEAETELEYEDPYELLVSVILSAQCTDKRVNLTTPALFKRFPNVKALSKTNFDELFPYIKSISYPNNKTKHLIAMANMVMEKFHGKIPMTVEELMQLPGVGRKTANVVTSVVEQQPNMPVDTHVFRVSKRIGLAPSLAKTPLAVEKELVSNIPEELIHKAHHWLILHGRYICVARNPRCEQCGVRPACRFYKSVILPKMQKN